MINWWQVICTLVESLLAICTSRISCRGNDSPALGAAHHRASHPLHNDDLLHPAPPGQWSSADLRDWTLDSYVFPNASTPGAGLAVD